MIIQRLFGVVHGVLVWSL